MWIIGFLLGGWGGGEGGERALAPLKKVLHPSCMYTSASYPGYTIGVPKWPGIHFLHKLVNGLY